VGTSPRRQGLGWMRSSGAYSSCRSRK
jgi:hypothetical protein